LFGLEALAYLTSAATPWEALAGIEAEAMPLWRGALAAEEIDDPEKQREADAQNNARDDRKIKASVAALVGDVAGQAAEAERELAPEEK
jgi:hypothetical protein